MFTILIMVMVLQIHVKTHQNVYITYVHFTVYQLYQNKGGK